MRGPSGGIAHGWVATGPRALRVDRSAAAEARYDLSLGYQLREEKQCCGEPHGDLNVDAGEPGALHGRRHFGKGPTSPVSFAGEAHPQGRPAALISQPPVVGLFRSGAARRHRSFFPGNAPRECFQWIR